MKKRPPWTPTYKISALRQLHPLVVRPRSERSCAAALVGVAYRNSALGECMGEGLGELGSTFLEGPWLQNPGDLVYFDSDVTGRDRQLDIGVVLVAFGETILRLIVRS